MSASLSGRQRLERALAIVPWIASRGGTASIDEVCRRFDIDVEQLQSCLATVSMVGVYPYTPDALLEVFMEPDHITVNLPEYFTRPLRLTPTQTFGLIAAGRALLALPDADPQGALARAIAKIENSTGVGSAVEIDIDPVPPEVREVLRTAIEAHQRIEIDHYNYNRDVWSTRVVDPWRIQAADGHWYLEGHCHQAADLRRFRIDRIGSVRVLDETFDPPAELPEFTAFAADHSLPTVTLDLAPAAAWVATQYPAEAIERLGDGTVRVTLAVSAPAWLERLLLRVGDDASIVEIDDSLRGTRAAAARRVLQHYLH